eukprot:TRINITY_DN2613_c0_g1_i1.p1 TRINITY_DN2613_c0_g1~~TRINITY_DN2613_c0_g1_i1.p1  ORF type:complete len:493 (+),score=155.62 TRINITY_DN2613_c0_g1_i1:80-1480(+)
MAGAGVDLRVNSFARAGGTQYGQGPITLCPSYDGSQLLATNMLPQGLPLGPQLVYQQEQTDACAFNDISRLGPGEVNSEEEEEHQSSGALMYRHAPPADTSRPCDHNDWDDVRTRKGAKILRCRACQSKWKLPSARVPRCAHFLSGHCERGSACSSVHVHKRKNNLVERFERFGDSVLRGVPVDTWKKAKSDKLAEAPPGIQGVVRHGGEIVNVDPRALQELFDGSGVDMDALQRLRCTQTGAPASRTSSGGAISIFSTHSVVSAAPRNDPADLPTTPDVGGGLMGCDGTEPPSLTSPALSPRHRQPVAVTPPQAVELALLRQQATENGAVPAVLSGGGRHDHGEALSHPCSGTSSPLPPGAPSPGYVSFTGFTPAGGASGELTVTCNSSFGEPVVAVPSDQHLSPPRSPYLTHEDPSAPPPIEHASPAPVPADSPENDGVHAMTEEELDTHLEKMGLSPRAQQRH